MPTGTYRGEKKWKEILEDWHATGLSQSEYCRQKNIPGPSFSTAKAKYDGMRLVSKKEPRFIAFSPTTCKVTISGIGVLEGSAKDIASILKEINNASHS